MHAPDEVTHGTRPDERRHHGHPGERQVPQRLHPFRGYPPDGIDGDADAAQDSLQARNSQRLAEGGFSIFITLPAMVLFFLWAAIP